MTDKRRINGMVAQQLGSAIVSGRTPPGTLLDGEIVASGKLAVSRSVYREALRILAAKGLVESRTRTGTRVLPRVRWRLLDPDVLGWFFAEGMEPDPDFVLALYELRQVVEPAAAGFAAARRSAGDLAALRLAVETMERFTFVDERGRAADRAFHDGILRATGNDIFANLADGIGAAVRWTTLFKYRFTILPRDPIPRHRRVFEAIAAGEAEAARREMAVLVAEALADLQAAVGAGPPRGTKGEEAPQEAGDGERPRRAVDGAATARDAEGDGPTRPVDGEDRRQAADGRGLPLADPRDGSPAGVDGNGDRPQGVDGADRARTVDGCGPPRAVDGEPPGRSGKSVPGGAQSPPAATAAAQRRP